MTTSQSPIPATTGRAPLRLAMAPAEARGPLDGVWWPQSRDLQRELADLVNHFPGTGGRIIRATFSPPDWDAGPNRVTVRHGFITLGSAAEDDTHVMMVRTSDRRELCLLVVPPGTSPERGEEALAAGAKGYAYSAKTLLAEIGALED